MKEVNRDQKEEIFKNPISEKHEPVWLPPGTQRQSWGTLPAVALPWGKSVKGLPLGLYSPAATRHSHRDRTEPQGGLQRPCGQLPATPVRYPSTQSSRLPRIGEAFQGSFLSPEPSCTSIRDVFGSSGSRVVRS